MKNIKTILLIDDMEIEHVNVKYVLEDYSESIKLISAYDGHEGIELLLKLQTPPDVILLDINMPCMNGLEFLAELDKTGLKNTLIIVMLTSSDQELDKKESTKYENVKGYIGKPLESNHIDYIKSLL